MVFEDDERYWFPSLTGEMEESSSDVEMDEDTLDDVYDSHIDALLYGDIEFEEHTNKVEQQRRKQAVLAHWKLLRHTIKVHVITNTFEAWLRLTYDHTLFKDGGRGAVAAKKHFYACTALQNACG